MATDTPTLFSAWTFDTPIAGPKLVANPFSLILSLLFLIWLLLVGIVFRGREIACLAAALGPLASLAAALCPLAWLI